MNAPFDISWLQGPKIELFGQNTKCTHMNIGGIRAAFIQVLVHREDPGPAAAARQDEAGLGQERGGEQPSRRGGEGAAARVRSRQGRVCDPLRLLRGAKEGLQLLLPIMSLPPKPFLITQSKKTKAPLPELEPTSSATASLLSAEYQVRF